MGEHFAKPVFQIFNDLGGTLSSEWHEFENYILSNDLLVPALIVASLLGYVALIGTVALCVTVRDNIRFYRHRKIASTDGKAGMRVSPIR